MCDARFGDELIEQYGGLAVFCMHARSRVHLRVLDLSCAHALLCDSNLGNLVNA